MDRRRAPRLPWADGSEDPGRRAGRCRGRTAGWQVSRKTRSCTKASGQKPDLSLSVPGVWIRPLLAFGDQRKARLAWLLLGSRERAGSCGAGEPASKSAFGGQASPLVGGVFCRKRSLSEFDTQGREMSLSVRMPWLPAWACALPGRTLRGGQLETAPRRDAPGGRRPPPDQGRRGSPSFPSPHRRCSRLTGRGRMTLTPKANTGKRARPQPA